MSRRSCLQRWREDPPVILPSLLLCDFGNLEREVARLEEAGVGGLHLDVMDGHFVPNFTYGMTIVEAVRRLTDLPLDVHLMIDSPQRYLSAFCDAGADVLTFHVEAVDDAEAALQQIRALGVGAGLAVNADTPLSAAEAYAQHCDVLLIMSVPAGYGGQSFRASALDKLREARAAWGQNVLLEIDGGIHQENIHLCAEAGAQLFAVGSAIFAANQYATAVRELAERAVA